MLVVQHFNPLQADVRFIVIYLLKTKPHQKRELLVVRAIPEANFVNRQLLSNSHRAESSARLLIMHALESLHPFKSDSEMLSDAL